MTDLVSQLVGALEGMLKGTQEDCGQITMPRNEAVRAAFAALTAAKAGGWVSVNDRLPEQYVEVLVAFDGITLPSTGQYTGNARDVNGWSYPSENFGSTEDGTDPIVTHWQPLPTPPKEQS